MNIEKYKIAFKKLDYIDYHVFSERPQIPFVELKQVHSSSIIDMASSPLKKLQLPEADGLISPWNKQIALAIKTADCIPLCFTSKDGFGILHVGYKGLAAGIIENLTEYISTVNYFHIGPSIKECCFEVQENFFHFFPRENYEENYLFQKGKIFFNLSKVVASKINDLFPDASISQHSECTCCNNKFHSYRRDKTTSRNWNIIIPKHNNKKDNQESS